MTESLRTVRDFIRWGASRFAGAGLAFGHGTDNALDESAALVLHGLHLGHDLPDDYLDGVLTQTEREEVIALLDQRITTRKPAAFLTHEAWFAGLAFFVDERVLVPRSPIAELIEEQFSPWVKPQRVARILDLCTGSGCIAIACAYAFPGAAIDAADVSGAALAVAHENVERHGLEQRVSLIESDIFESLGGQGYDIIVSNPPYVSPLEMQQLADEYHHEPALGLAAADEGLEFALQILMRSADHLTEHGILVMEVGNSQAALVNRLPEVPFLWLEFEFGGEGVFMMECAQLRACQRLFEQAVSRPGRAPAAESGDAYR